LSIAAGSLLLAEIIQLLALGHSDNPTGSRVVGNSQVGVKLASMKFAAWSCRVGMWE
jgi:hypothetical protein